jgi:hypothetical protein
MFCKGFVQTVSADPFEWAGGAGSWTVLDDWLDLNNPDGSSPPDYAAVNLPGSSDNVTINGGNAALNSGATILSLDIEAGLSLGLGSSLTVNNHYQGISEIIGNSGTGLVTQAGGTHTTLTLFLGYSFGSSGTYSLSGGTLNVNSTDTQHLGECIGFYGNGSFTQTTGYHYVGQQSLLLAFGSGSKGSYVLSGGVLASANSENVGYSGQGQFYQEGGSNSISGAGVLYIGALRVRA